MANEIIRPTQLPERADPVASEVVPSDNGASVAGVTWADGVNAAVPPASQPEAEAGAINTKRMTPLTTKQAIDAQVPPKIGAAIGALNLGTASQAQVEDFATAVQGTKADSAVQPSRSVGTGTGLTGGGNLSADRTISLSSGTIASLSRADSSVQTVNGLTPDGSGNVTIDAAFLQEQNSVTTAMAESFAPTVEWVRTAGGAAPGDGRDGLYIEGPVVGEDDFSSNGGARHWQLVDFIQDVPSALPRFKTRKLFDNISAFDVMPRSLADAIRNGETTGDDATEITARMNDLLNDVGSLVRGRVHAPAGVYWFTGTGMFVRNGLTLVGDGTAATRFRKAPGNTALDPILRESVQGGVFLPVSDVSLEGIDFWGNGDPSTPGAKGAGLVRFYEHRRFRAVNCDFHHSRGYGAGLQGNKSSPNPDRQGPHIDTYLEGCRFYSNGKLEYMLGDDADDGVDFKSSERLVVVNCRAYDNGDKGFDFRGQSVSVFGSFSYQNAGAGFSSGFNGQAEDTISVEQALHEYFGCHAYLNGNVGFNANPQHAPGTVNPRIKVGWNGCVARQNTHNFSVQSPGTNLLGRMSLILSSPQSINPTGNHVNLSSPVDNFSAMGGILEGGGSADGIRFNAGQASPVAVAGVNFRNLGGTGVFLSREGGARSSITGCTFEAITNYAIDGIDHITTSGNTYVGIGQSAVINATGQNCKITDFPVGSLVIASAANITLPPISNSFVIAGSTTIIGVTSSYEGRVVMLRFSANCTVTDSEALRLAGDFNANSHDILTLTFNNGAWHEVSRSVN